MTQEYGDKIKFASISIATATTTTLVAAVTGKSIKLRSFILAAAASTTAIQFDGSGGVGLTGAMTIAATDNFVAPDNPHGWMRTVSGEALRLITTGGGAHGCLTYEEI